MLTSLGLFRVRENILLQITLFFLLDSKRHHKKTNRITKNVSIELLENCLFPENIAVLRKKEDYCSIHTETKSPNDILNQDRFLKK